MPRITLTLLLASFISAAVSAAPQTAGVSFDGAGTYATVERSESLKLKTFTVSAWVKPQRVDRPQIFISRGGAAEQFTLYLYQNRVRMLIENRPGKYQHADAPLPKAGQWVHYAGTYDGEQIRLFVDGKLEAAAKASGEMPASDAPLFLGGLGPGERNLDGALEDVRIYGRVLSDDELAALSAPGDGPAAGLLARWTAASLDKNDWRNSVGPQLAARYLTGAATPCVKDDGYRGIWYFNQPSKDEYVYKYSGGLGTYCSSHNPFAVYRPEVNKTFFCYGGSRKEKNALVHMVSYYDHATGMVPRPTFLLDKQTTDAHDNPVISVDDQGHIWIFSSSHGTSRPSYVSVSKRPYDVSDFERVLTTNFSYTQPYYLPGQGFLFLQTLYRDGRRLHFQTSPDGRAWTEPSLYAAIDMGHYQVSWCDGKKVACAFNYHPRPGGLNYRTNLYYMETTDFGRSWHNAQGQTLTLPLTEVQNPALVHDYQAEGLKIYVQDLNFDSAGRPVAMYVSSKGFESGPENGPRVWHTAHFNGQEWELRGTIASDSNYDMGSIYVESDRLWRIIGPTDDGPQRYNPGGEIAMWTSTDRGQHWTKARQLTSGSSFNHGYCRRPVNANPEFYALWADGDARKPSTSRLYFCNREGEVRMLPPEMTTDMARPEVVPLGKTP